MRSFYRPVIFLLSFLPLIALQAQDSIPEFEVEKIHLKINLEPSASYRFASNNIFHLVQELENDTIAINHTMQADYIFEIESNTAEGIKIKAFYERLLLELNMDKDKLSDDSAEAINKETALSPDFSAMINKPFYVYMNGEGKVTKTEGLDIVLQENKDIAYLMGQRFFNEKSLISTLESSFNVFSKDSISMGETWNKNQNRSLHSQLSLDLEDSFTLESLSEDLAWINVEGQVKNTTDLSSENISLSGTTAGTVEVERETGLILFSEIKQELQGFLKLGEMQIPVRISSSSTQSGEKL